MVERDPQRLVEQRAALVRASAQDEALRVERAREELGKPLRLGDPERQLDPLERGADVVREEVQPAENSLKS